MSQKDLLNSALSNRHRRKHGLNVLFAGSDKAPKTLWEKWQKTPQSDNDVRSLYQAAENASCWGFICGFNQLESFDFDWPWIYRLWRKQFSERAETLTTRTPNGGYRPLYVVEKPRTDDTFKNTLHCEIKGPGRFIVFEGEALKEDGTRGYYQLTKDLDIRSDDKIVEDTVNWLQELNERYGFLQWSCLKEKYFSKKAVPDLPHEARLMLVDLMVCNGFEQDEILNFFKDQPDFKRSITLYQTRYTERQVEKGLKPPRCETLRKILHWSKEGCKGCLRKQPVQEKKKEEIDPETRIEADRFLEDPALLYRIHNAQGNVQGEDKNKVLLVILNWAKQSFEIEGETAAGKNTLADSILSLFPRPWWEKATGVTDKALRYLGETLRTLYLAERRSAKKEGEESTAEFDVKLVISEGELMVLVTLSDSEDPKRFKTERIRTKIENVILTSTELAIPRELQNRIWVVRVDESKEQNIRVRDAKLQGKEKLPSEKPDFSREKKTIQAAFAIAEEEAPKDVVIPYATLLTPLLDEKETRVRRDTDKLILLIEGITKLFYRQRLIILNGGDRKVLVSAPEDFWIAWKIGETAIKETFADMTEKDIQVLKWCKELDKDQKQITTKSLAELTKRTDSTCYKWLKALQSKGFLVEESRGSHGLKVYCLQSSDRTQVGIERIPIWQLQERHKNWLLARKEPKTSFLKQSFRSERGEIPAPILIDPIEGIMIDLSSFRPESLEEKAGNQTQKAEISSVSSSEKIARSESDLIRPSEEDWKTQYPDFSPVSKEALKEMKQPLVCWICGETIQPSGEPWSFTRGKPHHLRCSPEATGQGFGSIS